MCCHILTSLTSLTYLTSIINNLRVINGYDGFKSTPRNQSPPNLSNHLASR